MFIRLWSLCSAIAFGMMLYAATHAEAAKDVSLGLKTLVVIGGTVLGPITIGALLAEIAENTKKGQ